jgi:hypothetical protein
VSDLPNEGQNPYVMATLTPGVVDTDSGGYFEGHSSQYTNPYSGVAVQITAFGNSGHNRLTLDGIPNDAPERFSGASSTNFVPSPDAVQENKVEDGIFDAQIGHGNGVVSNVVVKNGTNNLHGSAYYVFENSYLDANTYDRNTSGKPRANNQVNQTGLVMDGPIVLPKLYKGRDKSFFMFSFERYATHSPNPFSGDFRVPTQAETTGDFSGLCPGGLNSSGFCNSSGGVQLFVPNSPVDANGSLQQLHHLSPLNSASDPFPTGVVLPTGNTLGLGTGLGQGINFNDQTHVQPRAAEYTLNIQQRLPYNIALQVGYVGSRPIRLEVSRNINTLPTQYFNQGQAEVTYLNTKVANPMAGQFASTYANNGTLNAGTIQQYLLLVPFPEFGSFTEQNSSIGSTPYNALQIQVSHPMSHHLSIQGNLTWDKLMLHNAFLNSGSGENTALDTKLESVQDSNSNLLANIFGTYELPKFAKSNYLERVALGSWKLNSDLKMANGNLISAPGGVNIIGPTGVANRSYRHFINTCYENASGSLVRGKGACSSSTDTPAYQQRLFYTTQTNSPYIGVREQFHPLMDASLFKGFPIREGTTFEIRGEFFNVLNSPIFGAPNTSIGSSSFGVVTLTQSNDPRYGQLTARLNF